MAAVVLSHLALAACLALAGTFYARHYLQDVFDTHLEEHARSVAALVHFRHDQLRLDTSRVPLSQPRIRYLDFFVVRSEAGDFMAHTAGYDPAIFNKVPSNARFWDFKIDKELYRAIILRAIPVADTQETPGLPSAKLTVIYAMNCEDNSNQVAGLAGSIAGTSLLLLIPTLWLSGWSIGKIIAPLQELAIRARSVSVRNWEFNPSANERAVVELEPLITAIETVLAGLQRAFARQREFLGDAAHELKTAFAIVKSTLQWTLNRPRTADEYRSALLQMSDDSDRLEELLGRMLHLARVEQWAADGNPRRLGMIDVSSTCEMAISRVTKLAAAHNIGVEFAPQASAQMPADPEDLELVWMNLLENAIEHSQPNSKVTITLDREAATAAVSVQDSGCGIPEAELPYIFERFRRGDPSRARATGGYGLGLAIAKSLVEAYGGTIHAASEVGQGTRISVRLPLAADA